MKEKLLYIFWAGLYVICTVLGFIPNVSGGVQLLLLFAAVGFFVPAFWLLLDARQQKNLGRIKLIRILSICSLGATLILLVANILSVTASRAVGNVLHILLVIFSTPMFCGQYWLVSLFLWAVLLMLTLKKTKK